VGSVVLASAFFLLLWFSLSFGRLGFSSFLYFLDVTVTWCFFYGLASCQGPAAPDDFSLRLVMSLPTPGAPPITRACSFVVLTRRSFLFFYFFLSTGPAPPPLSYDGSSFQCPPISCFLLHHWFARGVWGVNAALFCRTSTAQIPSISLLAAGSLSYLPDCHGSATVRSLVLPPPSVCAHPFGLLQNLPRCIFL